LAFRLFFFGLGLPEGSRSTRRTAAAADAADARSRRRRERALARDVELPYPTAFRFIQTLIHEGLIECEPTREHDRVTDLVQSPSIGDR